MTADPSKVAGSGTMSEMTLVPELIKKGPKIFVIAGDRVQIRFPSLSYNNDHARLTEWWEKEVGPHTIEYDALIQQLSRVSYEKRTLNPEEAAEKLLELYHFVTLADTEEIYCYDEEVGLYRSGGEVKLKAWLESNAESCNTRLVEETINKLRRKTYRKREDFDSDSSVLNLNNGLLNVDTFEFNPHSHEYLSLIQIPVSYDAGASCPSFARFLSEVVFKEDIPVIQEWFGYCLLKSYPAQKALLAVGDGGNGKSTLLGVLKAMLGIKNITSRSLQELELNRFAKADLFSKLANIYADLSDSALKSIGTFKMLTGGDPITAEHKFRNSFTFVNFAKLTFSANKVPEVYDDTTAFFRRWLIITFPNFFEGRADRNLLAKLTTPEEMSGVLNWVLEGLKRLRSNGFEFTNGKSVDQVREEYIRKSSPIRSFLMDCIESPAPTGQVLKEELYAAFVEYCSNMKLPVVGSDTFFKNLPMHVQVHTERVQVPGKDRRQRVFVGLRLKLREEWGKDVDNKIGETLDRVDRVDGAGQSVQGVQGFSHFSSDSEAES